MINTCLHCGRMSKENTKTIGGQTILENCNDCEHEILTILHTIEAPVRRELLQRAKVLNLPLVRYPDRYSTRVLQQIVITLETLNRKIEKDTAAYLE